MDLPRSQVSGGFPVSVTAPGTIVARIPRDAAAPATLTVLNRHDTAIMYLKWIPLQMTGQSFHTNDAAIVLQPTRRGYTWDNPPRDAMLVALSSVEGAILAVDGSWHTPDGGTT